MNHDEMTEQEKEKKRLRHRDEQRRYVKLHCEKVLEIVKNWRKRNPDKVKRAGIPRSRRWRANNHEKHLKYNREYKKNNREKIRKYWKNYRLLYPEKQAARRLLISAVRQGRIIKPKECSHCGLRGKIEGHHPDYSKPLYVIWLCDICHAKEHRKGTL